MNNAEYESRQRMFDTLKARRELKIAVAAPRREFVAFCGAFYEPTNRFGYVEPVVTDPRYRRLGLGKAAVLVSQPGQILLDAGIGSGLSAQLFAKAGLEIHGMDFSPAMLALCRDKGFTAALKQHDLMQTPWPYPAKRFDQLVCCGVLHFVPDLEGIFGEARRVLREGGLFAFTTKVAPPLVNGQPKYDRQTVGGFAIFSHTSAYIETSLASSTFTCLKRQNCFVGDDIFTLWVVQKN